MDIVYDLTWNVTCRSLWVFVALYRCPFYGSRITTGVPFPIS